MANRGRLLGKVCIVTGSTSGIGRGIAELFAREGASVVIAARREDAGAGVVKGIMEKGGIASFFRLDVSDEESWKAIVDYTLKTYGKLDVLVNNAGIGFLKPIVETTIPEWRNVMATNVESVFLGTKTVVPAMKQNGKAGGSIINISSNIVYVPSAMNSAYCTSKGAVASFSKVAAVELAKENIRVNTIFPGFVRTAILDVAYQKAAEAGRTKEELEAMFADSNLVGRIGEPIDIAYPVVFLACDESAFVTGSDFVIDGGEVWKRGGGGDEALADDSGKH